MIRDPLALATLIVALTALSLWLASSFGWAARLSATLLVIVFGAAAANLGLVASSSPVYDFLTGPATSLAIAWLLLAVDLRDLRAAGPRMLAAFALAVGATVTGALTAAALFGDALAADGWKLAGVMTGTYSGGGLNFVSVGRALDLPPALFTAATAADNIMTTIWVGATLVLPVWLARFYPPAAQPEPAKGGGGRQRFDTLALDLRELALVGAIGLALVLAAERAATHLPGPAIVWLTTLALFVGHLPATRDLKGAMPLGTFTLLLFFAVLGIGSRFAEVLSVGIEVFYFAAVVVSVHGVIVYSVARVARLDLETISVASQAAVGGPPTAMALALARKRHDLALPGAAVGLLGYAVGTYAGLAVAALVQRMGG